MLVIPSNSNDIAKPSHIQARPLSHTKFVPRSFELALTLTSSLKPRFPPGHRLRRCSVLVRFLASAGMESPSPRRTL